MKNHERDGSGMGCSEGWLRRVVLMVVATVLGSTTADAFQVYRGSDLKVLWDTKVKYSHQSRMQDPSNSLTDDPNTDDGNRNFDKGAVSNRFDVSSELDVLYRSVGFRVSGAAWYDFAYNTDNANDSPATANSSSVDHDEFTDDTRDLHGRDAELLDAFVFGSGSVGNVLGTLRVGQHTVLWGESLLFATNGISYGQAPLDIIRALSVPGTKAKELFLPVPQVSASLQPFESLSFEAFYQWQWEETRLPAAGSYVSDVDLLDEGGERLIAGPPPAPGLGPAAFYRGHDLDGDDSGQWGVAARLQPAIIDVEFGLYYYVFHERAPQVYLRPGIALGPPPPGAPPGPPPVIDPSVLDPNNPSQIGQYSLVYGEDIKVVGGSFSTQIGAANVSGEVSYRMDTPLVSDPQLVLPGVAADNNDDPLYAVGNTVHANLSSTLFLSPGALWDGGLFLGEVGWNRYTKIDKNSAALAADRERDAWGFRFILEPAYYQVFPGVDIKVPLGLGYNPRGKSAVAPKFNRGGADEGGDWSVGVNLDYLQAWQFGLSYTDYFGNNTYQTLQDRDLIAFSVQYTF